MKQLVVLFLLCCAKTHAAAPDLSQVRSLFEIAATEKKAADQLVNLLSGVNETSSPVLICYKGVAQMMLAKYGINPFNKFKYFKQGKTWIEQAAQKSPDNLEIKYLRFAIQSKLPSFLNYNEHMKADKDFLLRNVKTTTDKKLQNNIISFLLQSKYCSASEKKGLAT